MRKVVSVVLGLALVFAAGLFLSTGEALAQKKKKKILLDPEIRAAQKAVNTAIDRVDIALADEVFGERGRIERRVIDQLKIAKKRLEEAQEALRRAQRLDKGGD